MPLGKVAYVEGIALDWAGNVWACWKGIVYKFEGDSFNVVLNNNKYLHNCIYTDHDKNVWLSEYRKGVICYTPKGIRNYSMTEGLVDSCVTCMIQDRKGNMWFGTLGGISRFDGKRFSNFTIKDGLPAVSIYCLYEDSKGIYGPEQIRGSATLRVRTWKAFYWIKIIVIIGFST